MNEPEVIYADPAGNVTAIVRGYEDNPQERKRISQDILNSGKAEQVGFAATPVMGGDCRLEMMGGEFCGNATRAYGYLCTAERYDGGHYRLHVEITGAAEPVLVQVNLDDQTSYAEMPLPLGVYMAVVDGREYPVVHMEGIDHMVVEADIPEEDREAFVMKALTAMQAEKKEASGIMFLKDDTLTPAVYVRETDSLVWESSCGSGSVACGWYLVTRGIDWRDTTHTMTFREPGGVLEVGVTMKDGKPVGCSMGGSVVLEYTWG